MNISTIDFNDLVRKIVDKNGNFHYRDIGQALGVVFFDHDLPDQIRDILLSLGYRDRATDYEIEIRKIVTAIEKDDAIRAVSSAARALR